MDFELPEDVQAVRALARDIFADLAPSDRVVQVEQDEGGHDAKLWAALATSGLLGLAVPEQAGGAGLGMLGLGALLEAQGRHVAPLPLWSTLAGAALPLAHTGSEAVQARWLTPLLAGDLLVTSAFDAGAPRLTAKGAGPLRLSGVLTAVPGGTVAAAVVAPVTLPTGATAVVVLPLDRAGVTVTPVATTNHGNHAQVTCDDVMVADEYLLPGDDLARWALRRCRVAVSFLQAGVCAAAVEQTAAYVSQREQFGRPLSTFQAVAMRAADAYLDTQAIRLTAQKAALALDAGLESEGEVLSLVTTWWASRGGLRAVHATQHLHGGIGADVTYPIHRYFLWGRQNAFVLGSAAAVEAELGMLLPTAPQVGAPR